MSFQTPSSISEFTGRFENATFAKGDARWIVYYEPPTNTINFGYGVNLTGAAKSATTRQIVDTALRAQGIVLSASQWASIGSVTSSSQAAVLASLRASIPASSDNWQAGAAAVLQAFYTQIVDPELVAKLGKFNSLPTRAQWALEDLYYNSPKNWGPKIQAAAMSSDLVGIANEIAFDTTQLDAGAGAQLRALGRAALALGGLPTFAGDNTITSVDWSGSQLPDIQRFLTGIAAGNKIGLGGQSADSYIGKWGGSVATSFRNLTASLSSYAAANR